jgi:tRNA(fMet)-specific endonuclease VapC
MAQLIDSSIVIAAERSGRALQHFAHIAPDEPVALSSITASELLTGVHRAKTEAQRLRREAFVEGLLALLPVLPIDLRVARTHARLWAVLDAEGQPIGAHDLWIAATALTYGYAVCTQNIREFARVPRLEVRGPAA